MNRENPSLDNINKEIEYDYDDINNHTTIFKEKLQVLTDINEDDKICIWYDTIYKDNSIYGTQFIWRKLTGQGREYIKDYLTVKFKEYCQLLDMITEAAENIYPIEKQLITVMNDNKDFIKNIKPGLLSVKHMYLEDESLNISETIDSIIDNLDKFILI